MSISSTISSTQSQGQKFHLDCYDLVIKVPLAISDFLVDKAGHRLFDISRHVANYLKKLTSLLVSDNEFLGLCPSESRNSMFTQTVRDEEQLPLRLDLNEAKQGNVNDLILSKRPVKRPDMRSPSPGRLPIKGSSQQRDAKDIIKKIKLNASQVNLVKPLSNTSSLIIDTANDNKKKITLVKSNNHTINLTQDDELLNTFTPG